MGILECVYVYACTYINIHTLGYVCVYVCVCVCVCVYVCVSERSPGGNLQEHRKYIASTIHEKPIYSTKVTCDCATVQIQRDREACWIVNLNRLVEGCSLL